MRKNLKLYKRVQYCKRRSNLRKSKSSRKSSGSSSGKIKPSSNKNSNTMKKIWSSTDLVQAMRPTHEELIFRAKKANETDILYASSNEFKCTKCNSKFKEESKKVQVHPCLGVLMCQVCCDYYNDGEFSVDSDGEDKYCRWCGEGGTLFGCSKCICGFCKTCIKKHFGNEYLKLVEKDDDWLCFFCDPKPLWDQRFICSVAVEMCNKKTSAESSVTTNKSKAGSKSLSSSKKKTKSSEREKQPRTSPSEHSSESCSISSSIQNEISDLSNKSEKTLKKRIHSSSSDDSEISSHQKQPKKMKYPSFSQQELDQEESFESLKQVMVEKLERAVKLSEYQMAFGMKWTCKVANRLADPKCIKTLQDLQKECLKIKFFLSALASHLLEFCNSIELAEKSVLKDDGLKDSSGLLQTPPEPTGFSGIIKFLSFINNQVNVFVKKGFSLSDILEAEIYHENNVIGLKPVSKPSNTNTSKDSASTVSSGTSISESNGDSEPNPKTTEKVVESSDCDPLKITADEVLKTPEKSPNESEDFDSSDQATKDTRNHIMKLMQILDS